MVKYLIGMVDLFQSVNSLKLAKEINKYASKHSLIQDILIEVNIANEDSKQGLGSNLIYEFIDNITQLTNIRVRGLMAMMPNFKDTQIEMHYFRQIEQLFIDIRDKKYDNINMEFLSVGMSGDYFEAICHGANMVRIGNALFNKRLP